MYQFHYTYHLTQRIAKRGITKTMLHFVLDYGAICGDKYVANKKLLNEHIRQTRTQIGRLERLKKKFKRFAVVRLIAQKLHALKKDFKIAKKLLDKGGIVVVCYESHILTSYDVDSRYTY